MGGIELIRYRFFFFAGFFPYLLGQIIAFQQQNFLNWRYFYLGFLGIFLVLVAVELFNEHFDAKEGGDRIFSPQRPNISYHLFPFALCSMLLAFFIGLYFTLQIGWPIFLFSFLGFLAAYFYVGPPLRWAYRGLGEIVIALAYGPFMVLGSFYLQTKKIDLLAFFVSLICGLALFCLAILNEIPDYYQDRLVGKKNLVVRLGRQKSIKLLIFSFILLFILLSLGLVLKKIPLSGILSFLVLPRLIKNLVAIQRNYWDPRVFLSAINTNLSTYLMIMISLVIGYWLRLSG